MFASTMLSDGKHSWSHHFWKPAIKNWKRKLFVLSQLFGGINREIVKSNTFEWCCTDVFTGGHTINDMAKSTKRLVAFSRPFYLFNFLTFFRSQNWRYGWHASSQSTIWIFQRKSQWRLLLRQQAGRANRRWCVLGRWGWWSLQSCGLSEAFFWVC